MREPLHVGHVDLVGSDEIAGWAADLSAPNTVLEVVATVDGKEVGRAVADRLRHDLARLGEYGEGRHGFVLKFVPPLNTAAEPVVVVRVAASGTMLTRGVFRIGRREVSFPADPPPQLRPAAGPRVASRPPAARPRYVLHVGIPKTGTKYLQSRFTGLRARLQEHGVLYPTRWWPENPVFAHHQLAEDLKQPPNPRTADIFEQLNGCGSDVVLLSSEAFAPIAEPALRYLRELIRGAGVEIVFYTRRWSDWIPSQWQQAVKQGSTDTFPEWAGRLLANPAGHPGINQAVFWAKFATVFGRDSIKLISYSNLMDRQVDIFRHFCASVLRLPDIATDQPNGARVHESMGLTLTELIRCLNARQAMRGETPGFRVFHAYTHMPSRPDLADDTRLVLAAMERHFGEWTIDDGAALLDRTYAELNQYRDRLVTREHGENVFARRRRQCRFVRPDFLMEEGVADAVLRLSAALQAQLAARSAPVA